MKKGAYVTGIWLRQIGSGREILIEVDGKFKVVPSYSAFTEKGYWPMSEIIEMWMDDWIERESAAMEISKSHD